MPGHFFDSSALVKLYHQEAGTPVVDKLVNADGNPIRISRLTPAERTSAFAIKGRTQSINRDAELFLKQFRQDIATGKLEVFSVAESEFAMAESLVERYAFEVRLRALDALQLAVALELHNQGLVDYFVAADRTLLSGAVWDADEEVCAHGEYSFPQHEFFFGIEAAKEKGPAVDHFSLGIQNFKSEEAAAKLKKRGLKLDGVSKEGLKFVDPDGMLVQLNAPDYPGYLPGQQ